MNEEKRPLRIQLPSTVKTYDIEFADIVHNMVYIGWGEDLRLRVVEDT
jgi:acyl-CoA thioester hydrolase